MGLELREAALEDAADQKGSLDEAGGLARLDHSRWVQKAHRSDYLGFDPGSPFAPGL